MADGSNGKKETAKKAVDGLEVTEAQLKSIKLGDPLAENPQGRLKILGKDPRWHYAWRRVDEIYSCLSQGQALVETKEGVNVPHGKKESVRGKTVWTVPNRKTGEVELVLFRSPMQVFEQYKHERAEESRRSISRAQSKVADNVSRIIPREKIKVFDGETVEE